MKNTLKYILTLVIVLYTSGCESGFLDQVVKSDITTTYFYKTEQDFEQALVGCYSYVANRVYPKEGNYSYGMNIMGECGTDEVFANYQKVTGTYTEVHALDNYNNLIPTNYICQEIWINHYTGINATNEIISRVWNDTALVAKYPRIKQIAAEAAFLQALWYFDLVRIFGGVPVVEKPFTANDDPNAMERNSIQEVYTRIDTLLNYAKANLPDVASQNLSKQYGRARKLSAYGLSAKVNLQIAASMNFFEKTLSDNVRLKTQKYPQGINSYSWRKVENNGDTLTVGQTILRYYEMARDDSNYALTTYASAHSGKYLNDKFTDCFYPSESTDEILFEAVLSSGFAQDMSGFFGSLYGPYGQSSNGGGQKVLCTNNSVVLNTFTFTYKGSGSTTDYVSDGVQKDNRFPWTIATMNLGTTTKTLVVTNSFGFFNLGKFRVNINDTPNQERTPINNPILRMADVCLIYAEAVAEVNQIQNPGSEVPADALNFINVVRRRAGLTNYQYASSAGTGVCDYKANVSYADIKVTGNKEIKGYSTTLAYDGGSPIGNFRRAILNERILELVGEGHRWFDLSRFGVLENVVNAVTTWSKAPGTTSVFSVDGVETKLVQQLNNPIMANRLVQPFHVFRPIPAREIALHNGNLIQNYGY